MYSTGDINRAKALHARLQVGQTQAVSEAEGGRMNFDRNSDPVYMNQRHQRALYSLWFWRKGIELIERIRKPR